MNRAYAMEPIDAAEIAFDQSQTYLSNIQEKQQAAIVRQEAKAPETLEAVYENGIPYATAMKIAQALKTGQAIIMLPAIEADVLAFMDSHGGYEQWQN
jgi:hypothetical protein